MRMMSLFREALELNEAFHELGFYYADWKPANVLVPFSSASIVVGDFGVSSFGNEVLGYTPGYATKEVIDADKFN